jgi:hypothetical protein
MSSWDPINIDKIQVDRGTAILKRTDGAPLIQTGKVTWLSGEPEAGKGMLALAATEQELHANRKVLYLDFEDVAGTAVDRLKAMSVPVAKIGHLRYINPQEAATPGDQVDLLMLADQEWIRLVVFDGVSQAMRLQKWSGESGALNMVHWMQRFAHGLECAVVAIDHVTKNQKGRGRYAVGSNQKLAGTDVHIGMEVAEQFGRGRSGSTDLILHKDRTGVLRPHCQPDGYGRDWLGRMWVTAGSDGKFDLQVTRGERPPPVRGPGPEAAPRAGLDGMIRDWWRKQTQG